MRLLRMLRRFVWVPRAAALRMLLRTGPRDAYRGIELGVIAPLEAAPQFFSRIRDSLDLISRVDRATMGDVSQSLSRIVLVMGGGEVYLHPIRAYLVDWGTFQRRSVIELASAVIHEATHAALEVAGESYRQADRRRIEEVCVAAEAEFLLKAGCPPEVIEDKRRQLETEWWSTENLRARRRRQLASAGIRLPPFITRAWKRISASREE